MKNTSFTKKSLYIVGVIISLSFALSFSFSGKTILAITESTTTFCQEVSSVVEKETITPSVEITSSPKSVKKKAVSTKTKKKKKKKAKKKRYAKIKRIRLNQKKIRLNKGDHRYLTAIVQYKGKRKKKEPYLWKSSKPSVVKVTQKGVVFGRKKGKATIKVYSKCTKKCAKCKVTVAPTKYIAITFDDGPNAATTNRLLRALNKYDSKATFLLVGSLALRNPSIVKKEFRSGMQIGNHTWNHANLNASSAAEIRRQISLCKSSIKKILGRKPSIFRPPYGSYNGTVSKTVDVPMIYWSVDTLDWKYRNTNYVYNTVLSHAYDGAVVLLHDIHPTSVNGFIKALPTLIHRHYELVTVDELFKIRHKKMKKGVMYYDAKK